MKPSLKFLVLPLAIGAMAFAGCGSDDSSDDTTAETGPTQTQPADTGATTDAPANEGAAQVLTLAADPSGALAYDTTELTAQPGDITIDFTNDSPVAHDVVIDDPDGNEVAATPVVTNESTSTEFTATAGDYTFYCSVPGHEAAGMKGTLTVE